MKRFKMLFWVLLPALLLNLNACNLDCGDCVRLPDPLNFRILGDNDVDWVTEGLLKVDSFKFYYLDGETRKDVQFALYEQGGRGYLYTEHVPVLSLEGVKTFYIRMGDGKLDTLFVDIRKQIINCCPYYSMEEITFNGVKVEFNALDFNSFYLRKNSEPPISED